MPLFTATVSLAVVAVYFAFALRVAAAHRKFGVVLPATSGNQDFERIYRAHINTLEWMPIFLVPLWLTALLVSDKFAAGLGVVWIVGRIWYVVGYGRAVEMRFPGFFLQSLVCVALFLASLAGVAMRLPGL